MSVDFPQPFGPMMPILSPAGVQEVLDYGAYGYAMSRYSGCWVGLKCVKDTIEATAVVNVNAERLTITTPTAFEMPKDGVNIRAIDDRIPQEARLHDYKRFAAEAFTEHPNCKDPVRRLKIGYLSPDLCGHTVALYSEVLLKYRDPEKYHLTAYFCKKEEDAHSGRLREYVDKWVNLFGTTAGEAARIIRDDQIDILVELTGHTANNRLDILACRPAPIQVSPVGKPAVPCKLGQSPRPAEPGQQARCAL